MIRTRSLLWLAAILLVLAPVSNVTFAGEEAPKVASEEAAKKALEVFKDEYKAKGLKGDDKLMQRDFAIKNLVKTVHPLIAKELGKIAKKKDADLSTLAVIYMGELRDVAGTAGPEVVAAMKRHKRDTIFQMSALDTIGYMRYLGANDQITSLMKHKDFAVKKYAIRSAGWTGDIRLMPALLKLLGIDAKNEKAPKAKGEGKEKKGESESKEDGYSWEGTDVEYDTGTSGDHDQQMAEKIGKEKMAQNKANAASGKGGGGGASGGTSVGGAAGATGGRGASGRTLEELVPTILRALKGMTGEEFGGPKDIKLWLRVNQKQIRLLEQRFERREKAQKKSAKGA